MVVEGDGGRWCLNLGREKKKKEKIELVCVQECFGSIEKQGRGAAEINWRNELWHHQAIVQHRLKYDK